MTENKFDEIRPYNSGKEINDAFLQLTQDEQFMAALMYFFPQMNPQKMKETLNSFTTPEEFQLQIILPAITQLLAQNSLGVTMSGAEAGHRNDARVYISNHRDIVLDPLLLCKSLMENGLRTTEVAIGNNLFVTPWLEPLVRINKNIVVKRNVPIRQMLEVSTTLSEYIRYAITEKKVAVWIAQREGRAKDSNDKTQDSLLKMLNISGKGSISENFKQINITPLCISYEYDPCDYLKAKEFQLKRDCPDYKKTQQDDLTNMLVGIKGWKGHVHFAIADIDDKLDNIAGESKNEQISALAKLIDEAIFKHYQIYPCNRIAYDLLTGENRFVNVYTAEEKAKFEAYLQGQLDKIDIPNKDIPFLQTKILEMYSNPLKNQLIANGEL